MMDNKKYTFLIFAFVMLAFTFVSGCGRYIVQYTAPSVIASSPAMGATGAASNETLTVKFSKAMDISNMDLAGLVSKVKFAPDMNAVITFDAAVTPEALWSEDNSVLTVTNVRFVSSDAGARVHIIASREAFIDRNGLYLPEDSALWNYTLQ